MHSRSVACDPKRTSRAATRRAIPTYRSPSVVNNSGTAQAYLGFASNREIVMSEKIKLEMISRRGAFSLLGLAAALSLVVPATVMTATDAKARVGNPASAVSVAGVNRRNRREDRRYKKSPSTTAPTTTGK
jgi:hypothetical protein